MKLFSALQAEYIYPGVDFEYELLKSKEWIAEKSGANHYQVFPHVGVGTLRVNGIPIPIKLNIQLNDDQDGARNISLFTKTRPEHYFIFVLFALSCIMLPLTLKNKAWVVIYPIILWFPVHVFFQFVIRVQEEMLMSKVVQKLGLKPLPE